VTSQFRNRARVLALALVVGFGGFWPALAQSPGLPSATDFGRADAIGEVSISRDGKHIAALTSLDGKRVVVSVWATDAMKTPPAVISADPRVKFLSVQFLKNDRLLISGVQPFTSGADRIHVGIQFITNLEGSKQTQLLPETGAKTDSEAFAAKFGTADIIDSLPLDPTDVIAIDNRASSRGDIYRINIYSGVSKRIERASDTFNSFQTDLKGEIRGKQKVDYENGAIYVAQYIKDPNNGAWQEHFRWYAKDREPQELIGFSPDPNIVYVRSSKGADKAQIYEYDVTAKKLLDPIFAFKGFESTGVVQSRAPADYGQILGFNYNAASPEVYWTDGKLADLSKQIKIALKVKTVTVNWTDPGSGETAKVPAPDGASAQIIDYSADRSRLIVEKSGENLPPEYFLLKDDGTMVQLGRSRPWLDTGRFGQTRLVEYAARDGLVIPAFLTTPNPAIYGPGPYPTLIEPHGGPWARDEMGWDVSGWVQYFAARGYAVLRPQFRGSQGWGQKLWRAGDGEWGQKMQDDKDDGVKWLIDQKIADPNRVAMFGYSYGGYAALAAAIRPNGLYQCAISGAGAGDLASIGRATFDNRFQREFQHPTIKGLDALDKAADVSIPVFLYHGDRDTTVDIKQSRKFAAILKENGKPYRMLEIKDMGHQFVYMTPDDVTLQLTEVERFLNNECGPGGL
jgi:dipeptidyl aminopeptidase/acylaminoacyl peptidase